MKYDRGLRLIGVSLLFVSSVIPLCILAAALQISGYSTAEQVAAVLIPAAIIAAFAWVKLK